MSRWMVCLAAALGIGAAALVFRFSVQAEEPKDTAKEIEVKESPSAKAANDVGAAFRLASYGRENKCAEALILAARMIGTTSFQKVDLSDAKAEKAEAFDGLKMANELLDEAGKIDSPHGDLIAKLAAATKKEIAEADRGASHGPQSRRGTVSDRDRQDTFPIRFRGGERAIVIVNNVSNRGDINCIVTDDDGRVVARNFSPDDDASCEWFVRRSGTFYVKVKKHGERGGPLHYVLTTN